ncbi:hypothetical protein F4859DRAFT_458488 [Xylaria cf. heliscus]|nr:hypothetical protein F4859DRAFT_458488 [Xylaria cf. heliscus]
MAPPNPNPRYKGKNYDPNYNARRNQPNQPNQQGNAPFHSNPFQRQGFNPQNNHPQQQQPQGNAPYHSNPFQRQGPPWRNNLAQQQQQQYQYPYPQPYPHQQGYYPQQPQQQYPPQPQLPQQYGSATSSPAAMQVLDHFRNQVHAMVTYDLEGDFRVCNCDNHGGTTCYHGIAKLYRDQLVNCAELQHDIVELLNFLIQNEGSPHGNISTHLREYVHNNPDTPLQIILETMGVEGLVSRGVGAAVGPGVDLVIDNLSNIM